MPEKNIIVYKKAKNRTDCIGDLNHDFFIDLTFSKDEFVKEVKAENYNAGIICLSLSDQKRIEQLFVPDEFLAPINILSCTETLDPEFINTASKYGINRFLDITPLRERIK